MSGRFRPFFARTVQRKLNQTQRFDASDFEQASTLVSRFGPSTVFVCAMRQEPWLARLKDARYTPTLRLIVESDRSTACVTFGGGGAA